MILALWDDVRHAVRQHSLFVDHAGLEVPGVDVVQPELFVLWPDNEME